MTVHGRSFGAAYGHDFTLPVLDGQYVLTVGRNVSWFPSHLALRDAKDGSVSNEYWHPGAIDDVVLSDFDGDGTDEILMAGINNPGPGPGHAAVFLLDLPFGAARTGKGNTNYFWLDNRKEEWYVLLPRPDLLDVGWDISSAYGLHVENGSVQFAVGSRGINYGYYTLSPATRRITFQATDAFFAKHRELELSGVLDHQVTRSEVETLGNVLWFETAPDGNSPELNEMFEALDRTK